MNVKKLVSAVVGVNEVELCSAEAWEEVSFGYTQCTAKLFIPEQIEYLLKEYGDSDVLHFYVEDMKLVISI